MVRHKFPHYQYKISIKPLNNSTRPLLPNYSKTYNKALSHITGIVMGHFFRITPSEVHRHKTYIPT